MRTACQTPSRCPGDSMRDFASLGSVGAEGKSNGLSALARRHKNEIITERNSQLDARSLGADVRWNAPHE